MDLKSGCFYWDRNTSISTRMLNNSFEQQFDVVVVGAGITGALLLDGVMEMGSPNVLLIDCRGIARGSTLASTAIVEFEIDRYLTELTKLLGLARATQAYCESLQAVRALRALLEKRGISDAFRSCPSLYLAESEDEIPDLEAECKARRSAGLPCNFLNRSDIWEHYKISAPAALFSLEAGSLDPVRTTNELIAGAIQKKCIVAAPLELMEFKENGDVVELFCSNGVVIRTRKLVFATGYESLKWIPEKVAELHSTYALTTGKIDPAKLLHDLPSIWTSGHPYFYLRFTPDNRIMCGGNDKSFSNANLRDQLIPSQCEDLLRQLHELLPQLSYVQAEYTWAGTFAETKDSLPLLGPYPKWKNVFFALAFGGNGITFAAIARRMLQSWFMNKKSGLEEVFGFNG